MELNFESLIVWFPDQSCGNSLAVQGYDPEKNVTKLNGIIRSVFFWRLTYLNSSKIYLGGKFLAIYSWKHNEERHKVVFVLLVTTFFI